MSLCVNDLLIMMQLNVLGMVILFCVGLMMIYLCVVDADISESKMVIPFCIMDGDTPLYVMDCI